MADIFMSYASHDLATILPLAKALEQEGWSVFWDREIPLGKTWRQVLDHELSTARCIIVVWTETSVGRRWVLEEAEEAQRRGILIPVFMDRVDAPRGFREVQGASLVDWGADSKNPEFVRLCQATRDLMGTPSRPPLREQRAPDISQPKESQHGWVSRLKWIALALGLLLVAGGSWLGYQLTSRQPEVANVPIDEPVPEADDLTTAHQYQQACNRGSAQDCVNLGLLYAEGRGVAKDEERVAKLFQKACDGGEAGACMNLGARYEQGQGVAKDRLLAAKLYKQACDAEVARACMNLGLMYAEGRGVAKNEERAAKLFQKACDGGEAGACMSLGLLCEQGRGVAKDPLLAAKLYKQACDAEVARACMNLGLMYAEGHGVAKDEERAAKLFQQACNEGEAGACMNLGALYEDGRGVAKDEERAAKLYKRACDAKIAGACMNLGALYEDGRGVAKNSSRAARLYKQACDGGDARGCERLKLFEKRRRGRAKEPARTTTETRAATSAEAGTEVTAQKRAHLRVTVSPWGDVWINGANKHRAPWNLSLEPGTYTIGAGRGSPTKTRVIQLKPGERKTEHFDLSN